MFFGRKKDGNGDVFWRTDFIKVLDKNIDILLDNTCRYISKLMSFLRRRRIICSKVVCVEVVRKL